MVLKDTLDRTPPTKNRDSSIQLVCEWDWSVVCRRGIGIMRMQANKQGWGSSESEDEARLGYAKTTWYVCVCRGEKYSLNVLNGTDQKDCVCCCGMM